MHTARFMAGFQIDKEAFRRGRRGRTSKKRRVQKLCSHQYIYLTSLSLDPINPSILFVRSCCFGLSYSPRPTSQLLCAENGVPCCALGYTPYHGIAPFLWMVGMGGRVECYSAGHGGEGGVGRKTGYPPREGGYTPMHNSAPKQKNE